MTLRFLCRRTARALAATILLSAAARVLADEPPIEVNPNRPSFATPARTTQEGVAELELGLQDNLPRDGGSAFSSPFLLKLGILSSVELRLGGNGLLRQSPPSAATATGFGDTTLGAQWRYLKNRPLGLDLAIQATTKLPTGSSTKGLGSGRSDTLLMLLFSRDLGPYHVDVNAIETWLGVPTPAGGGHERQAAGTVCVSRTLDTHWSFTSELYTIGATSQNPRIISNLWAAGYKVSSRLVLDAGADVGVSHGAQKISFFAGLTAGLGRFRHPARH
jgi:hypothetical protein